jgi:hypothetical protein
MMPPYVLESISNVQGIKGEFLMLSVSRDSYFCGLTVLAALIMQPAFSTECRNRRFVCLTWIPAVSI